MDREREPKKSETFDVRLPHGLKQALMRKAREEGRSASAVIRQSIRAYLAERPKEKPMMLATAWKAAAVAGPLGAALLWAAFASTPVTAGADLRAAFDSFDQDRDGNVTLDDFRAAHAQDRTFSRPMNSSAPSKPFVIPISGNVTGSLPPGSLLKSEFAAEDRDRNGSVDFDEFKSFHVAMMGGAFEEADRNRDGGIDRSELSALVGDLPSGAPRPSFEALDHNRDGRIERDEFAGDSDWGK